MNKYMNTINAMNTERMVENMNVTTNNTIMEEMVMTPEQCVDYARDLFMDKGYNVEVVNGSDGRLSKAKVYTENFGRRIYMYDLMFYRNYRDQYCVMLKPLFYPYNRYIKYHDSEAKRRWECTIIKLWKTPIFSALEDEEIDMLERAFKHIYSLGVNIETNSASYLLDPNKCMGDFMVPGEGPLSIYMPAIGYIFNGSPVYSHDVENFVNSMDAMIKNLDTIQ